MVASGGSDSSAQVLRNSRPEFRPPDAATYGFITEMLTTRASGVGERVIHAHNFSSEVCTLGLSSSMHAVLVIFVSNIIVLCYSFLPYAVSIAFL